MRENTKGIIGMIFVFVVWAAFNFYIGFMSHDLKYNSKKLGTIYSSISESVADANKLYASYLLEENDIKREATLLSFRSSIPAINKQIKSFNDLMKHSDVTSAMYSLSFPFEITEIKKDNEAIMLDERKIYTKSFVDGLEKMLDMYREKK